MMKQENRLPTKRWLKRAEVIEYLGSRRELERMERERKIVAEYPAGLKHKRFVRAQVLAAVEHV
jgi:hypothetical protein